ncbi:TonB-dependent receptor [Marinifilum flexuosum]|uniref:TonB-dependent receptor n=1 Tax=Marinifilum flexuosum TaxID=1117708 RepID=UPI0024959587|nr:TonB-dependent receptor [Marinifilum flexuosum]
MRYIAITICLLIQLTTIQGQTIKLQKDSVSFNEIILVLEAETDFHFFYHSSWVDQYTFSPNFSDVKPITILNWLKKETQLNYNIIHNKNVIFSKGHILKTNFYDQYLNHIAKANEQLIDTNVYARTLHVVEETKTISDEYRIFTIGNKQQTAKDGIATLSGKITDSETGESIIGAIVYLEELGKGTVTNQYGRYSISLPIGSHKIEYRSVGMKTTFRKLKIYSNDRFNVELKNKPTSLKEVTVIAKSENQVKNLRMGMEKITLKTLKQLPLGMGEADIIKSTLLLPGVQSVGEAASGFNVRGGNTDQNLILLNEAPIINTSHFFGFFSGFNSDIIKDITLYKSGIPAKYGGRISSVMDLKLKDGNRKQYKLSGGISPVSGRVSFEGPIKKDKASFILAGRTTYSDWVLKLLNDKKLKNSSANFHDLQGNVSWDIDERNSIFLSGYYSHDEFDYYQEDKFNYNTFASTLKWKHIYSSKLFSTISSAVSKYNYTNVSGYEPSNAYQVKYQLDQYLFKVNFSFLSSLNHKIDFGLNSTFYDLSPGIQSPYTSESLIRSKKLEKEQALEMTLFIGDEFDLTNSMSVSAGLRYSFFSNIGPKNQAIYLENLPRNLQTYLRDERSGSGLINKYSGPEIRISSNIKLSNNSSVKLGYDKIHQYVQMISNTTTMTPTDIWKLSDEYIKPQVGHQFSIGYYRNFKQNSIEASIESYYKKLDNILDYKGGAQLLMNEYLERDVVNGKGKAYGLELMVRKKKGKLTGWINYTYSKILHKVNGEFAEEKINNGDYFSANYDKPHNFNLVTNYKASRRFNFSINYSYSTGRPFTPPVAYYNFSGADKVHYSDRNTLRMPNYSRLDIAATLNGNLIAKKLNHSSFTFSVFNLLGRKNAYNIFFRNDGTKVQGYKMSIFGRPIFTITYNFKLFGNAKDDF